MNPVHCNMIAANQILLSNPLKLQREANDLNQRHGEEIIVTPQKSQAHLREKGHQGRCTNHPLDHAPAAESSLGHQGRPLISGRGTGITCLRT